MKRFLTLLLTLLCAATLSVSAFAADNYFLYTWDDATDLVNDDSLVYSKWGTSAMELAKDENGGQYLVVDRSAGQPRLDFTKLDTVYSISHQYVISVSLNFQAISEICITANDGSKWNKFITFQPSGDLTVIPDGSKESQVVGHIDLNTWYDFEIRMDEDAKVYTVAMDGKELYRGAVASSFANTQRLLLSWENKDGTSQVYVDNFRMAPGEALTLEAPVETQPAAVTQSAAETQPAASAAPAPATADASVIAAVMAAVGACGAALLSGTRKKSGRS